MTARQRIQHVAAQYMKIAKTVTREAAMLESLANLAGEETAVRLLEQLEAEGLIDADGQITLSVPTVAN